MHSTALLVASESLPVVDIDNTLFLQALLFLFLFVVLNYVLFKPWLEIKERRAKRIGGALEDAVELRERARANEARYAAQLSKARDEAMSLRSERRRAAEDQEASIVDSARHDAAADLDARKQALGREVEQARAELGARVDELARDITTQVLGRPA
jgi:F-type H+-transporting ATPase subunit b